MTITTLFIYNLSYTLVQMADGINDASQKILSLFQIVTAVVIIVIVTISVILALGDAAFLISVGGISNTLGR